jgi:hypothetical protein
MKKQILYKILGLSAILGFSSSSYAQVAPEKIVKGPIQQGHPGYFEQWFNDHKNSEGIIPYGLSDIWYKHDLSVLGQARTEGESTIASVEQLAPTVQQAGRTRAILVDISDSTRMFAGAISGGLWRSTNGGLAWTAINDAASTLAVSCLAQNPLKPREIYYGTGENRGNSAGIDGAGVFKSTDGGLTFTKLPSTDGVIDMRFCMHMMHSPTQDSVLYLGTYNGLYRTLDAGATWAKVLTGNISGIVVYPNGSVLATNQGGGMLRSLTGASGSFVNVVGFGFPTAEVSRISLTNCRDFPQVTIALFCNGPGGARYFEESNLGVFKSADGGVNWVKIGDKVTAPIGTTYSAYTQALGMSAIDTNAIAIMAATGAAITLNGGTTWQEFNYGHADNHEIRTIGRSSSFLIGSDGGVHRKTWSASGGSLPLSAGYTTFQYYAGNYGSTGKVALGGTQDNGTWYYRSPNTTSSVFGGDGSYCHISQQNPDQGYVSTQNGTLYKRTLSGSGSVDIKPPYGTETVDFINQYEMNYADGLQLFFRTGSALWRTIDAGNVWERLNPVVNITGISAIGVQKAANPKVYVGGANCFYRVDNAATFDVVSDTIRNLRSIVPAAIRNDSWGTISFHPTKDSILYVGLTTISTSPRAWKVVNSESTAPRFVSISGNLPSRLSVYQVQAHPQKPDSVLFAATAFGLYISENGGVTWEKETRVPNVPIFEMKLRSSDNTLFLFTHGRGVFYIKLVDFPVGNKEVGSAAVDCQLFPNPAGNVLSFVSKEALNMVQIYDLTGRELLSTQQPDQPLDISILKSGIYVARIFNTKGGFTTKKFVKE